MLFAIGPGSDGDGSERYSLYVPFSLAPEHQLQATQEYFDFSLQGYSAQVRKLEYFYCIKVGPFPTAESACAFLDTLKACLLRLSLVHRIGISYPKQISEVHLYDEPVEISEKSDLYEAAKLTGWSVAHGDHDADKIAIIPEHKSIWRFQGGRVALMLGRSIEKFAELLAELAPPKAIKLGSEFPRLKLAIELYNSCAFDLPPNAQLVTLVSALESITPDVEIPKHVEEHLEIAKATIRAARDTHSAASEAYQEVDHLLNRLGLLKRQSIGTALRAYVMPLVEQSSSLQQFEDVTSKLRKAYRLRSTLLHSGIADKSQIEESLQFLREFVRALLIELLDRRTSLTQQTC